MEKPLKIILIIGTTIISGILVIWVYDIKIDPFLVFAFMTIVFAFGLTYLGYLLFVSDKSPFIAVKKKQYEKSETLLVFEKVKKAWGDFSKGEKLSKEFGVIKKNIYPTIDGQGSVKYGFSLTRTSTGKKGLPIVIVADTKGEIEYVNDSPNDKEIVNPFALYSPHLTGSPVAKPDLSLEPSRMGHGGIIPYRRSKLSEREKHEKRKKYKEKREMYEFFTGDIEEED